MANFDSTKLLLNDLLEAIIQGKIQLPDFQRGWIWDDEHIRSLLVSIARDFPIGAIMLLETGGETRFQVRLVEGVDSASASAKLEHLILDGQQRLTSLIQALKLTRPVKTNDTHNRDVDRYYYINIEKALLGGSNLDEAIIGVDATKTLREDFGRRVVLDLSTPENEYHEFYFPCSQILDRNKWEYGLFEQAPSKVKQYMAFRAAVLDKFSLYQIPVIDLAKENSKEAVCLVFEKVNTGGVPLSVFDLVTATYAADGFSLRDDWFGSRDGKKKGRREMLASRPLLHAITATDFLQGVSLLHTYERHAEDVQAGRSDKETTPVSAKREHVLNLPLAAYQRWADELVNGFLEADRFLRQEGFRKPGFLPYRTQLVPLAAVMVHLGNRWLEPVPYNKIRRWFWCGVFGELYGGAVETRIALDMADLLAWIDRPGAPEPATVVASGFQESRLDTMRTRTSAAYRGLYVLLQREGAQDFFWKTKIADLDDGECRIDIHHIFPSSWCLSKGISDRVFNSIVNKTALSYKANRMIGGNGPSQYLGQLRANPQVQISEAEQDAILATHLIDPGLLRSNNFEGFYQTRKQSLLEIIRQATGKPTVTAAAEAPGEDEPDEEANE